MRKIAILASGHQVPIAPHDCVGPVNMFACMQVNASTPNVMIMEYNRAMHRGWYRDFIAVDLDIRDGFIHAPHEPGIGTWLRADVRERSDASIRTSDEPRESWRFSRKRYTYPPEEIQQEFLASTPRRRAGSSS